MGVGDAVGFVGGVEEGKGAVFAGAHAEGGDAELDIGDDVGSDEGGEFAEDVGGDGGELLAPDGVFDLDDQTAADEPGVLGVTGDDFADGQRPDLAGEVFHGEGVGFQLRQEASHSFHFYAHGSAGTWDGRSRPDYSLSFWVSPLLFEAPLLGVFGGKFGGDELHGV